MLRFYRVEHPLFFSPGVNSRLLPSVEFLSGSDDQGGLFPQQLMALLKKGLMNNSKELLSSFVREHLCIVFLNCIVRFKENFHNRMKISFCEVIWTRFSV